MPRLNTPKKLDWIHSAIQEAQKGNTMQLAQALVMVEAIQRRYFHAAKKPWTYGALQATEKVISLIDMRKSSGEGTMGMRDQIAEIIDQETRSPRTLTTMKQIARDADFNKDDGYDQLTGRLIAIRAQANAAVEKMEAP